MKKIITDKNTAPETRRPRRKRRTADDNRTCHLCRKEVSYCWSCRCGFLICQECMKVNLWGLTCNNIDWECPDCGRWNGFGNQ